MAGNYTEHYQLSQWQPQDRVLRTEFNQDNARIDAALKDLEDTKAEQAAVDSLTTAVAGKAEQAALDSLTHPEIVRRIRAAKQAAQDAGAPLFVLDGAVIVGTAAQAECDRLCVVTAPFETSVARIVARDGISDEMAARRLNAQTPEQTLTAQADYTLHNDAGLEALQAAAARLCEQLQAEGGVTAAP